MALLPEFRYINGQDVHTRLHGTIVRYKGHPVYVDRSGVRDRENGDQLEVDLKDVLNDRWIESVHSSDDELDIAAFPIGYAKYRDTFHYFTRIPTRHPSAGLSTRNMSIWSRRPDGTLQTDAVSRDILLNREFHKCLDGEYPSLKEALKTVAGNGPGKTIAIDRKIALVQDEVGLVKLSYFARPIAVYNENVDRFIVTERLAHYVPIIQSMGIMNCGTAI